MKNDVVRKSIRLDTKTAFTIIWEIAQCCVVPWANLGGAYNIIDINSASCFPSSVAKNASWMKMDVKRKCHLGTRDEKSYRFFSIVRHQLWALFICINFVYCCLIWNRSKKYFRSLPVHFYQRHTLSRSFYLLSNFSLASHFIASKASRSSVEEAVKTSRGWRRCRKSRAKGFSRHTEVPSSRAPWRFSKIKRKCIFCHR